MPVLLRHLLRCLNFYLYNCKFPLLLFTFTICLIGTFFIDFSNCVKKKKIPPVLYNFVMSCVQNMQRILIKVFHTMYFSHPLCPPPNPPRASLPPYLTTFSLTKKQDPRKTIYQNQNQNEQANLKTENR